MCVCKQRTFSRIECQISFSFPVRPFSLPPALCNAMHFHLMWRRERERASPSEAQDRLSRPHPLLADAAAVVYTVVQQLYTVCRRKLPRLSLFSSAVGHCARRRRRRRLSASCHYCRRCSAGFFALSLSNPGSVSSPKGFSFGFFPSRVLGRHYGRRMQPSFLPSLSLSAYVFSSRGAYAELCICRGWRHLIW